MILKNNDLSGFLKKLINSEWNFKFNETISLVGHWLQIKLISFSISEKSPSRSSWRQVVLIILLNFSNFKSWKLLVSSVKSNPNLGARKANITRSKSSSWRNWWIANSKSVWTIFPL